MPRSASTYLMEMHEICQFLMDRTVGLSLDAYLHDKTLRLAVERCFITIGEAVNQLHHHHPSVGSAFSERPGMVAFRNVIVHRYWAVDDEDVYSTLISKVPALKEDIERTMKSLGDDEPTSPQ